MPLPALLLAALPFLGKAAGAAALGAAGIGGGMAINRAVRGPTPKAGVNAAGGQSKGNFLTGSPGGFEQATPFAQWQQPYFQQLAQMGAQGLQNPYQGFEGIEDYARSNFQKKTIPSLAERFSSMGTNALSSPDFAYNNLQAGQDLDLGLAALRAQYGQQNQSQLMQMLGMGLTPQYQNYATQSTPGALGGFLQSAAPAIGRLGANALGGYLGAQQGQGGNGAYSAVINGLKGI